MHRKPATIYDVAARAGVSKSLVSLVLRGSDRVSEEKREAVARAVRELNYTPSRLAAGLAGTRTRSIGVVIDDFANLWFTEALVGMREALATAGYTLSVADVPLNAHLDLDPLEAFRSLRVDGVIIAGESSERAADHLATPAVVLGRRTRRPAGVPVVDCDEERGGRLVAEHFLSLGRRSLVAVTADVASASARCEAFRRTAEAAGARVHTVTAAHTTEAAARAAFAAWIGSRDTAPDGVFAANDPMAVGVLGVLRDRGLRVPERVSVVGYDNTPLADYAYLSLTSIDCGVRRQGALAAEKLVQLIAAGARPRGAGSTGQSGQSDQPGRAAGSAPGSGGDAAQPIDPAGRAPGADRALLTPASEFVAPSLVVRGSTARRA